MLEVIEIISRSAQGITRPFLCRASDGKTYFVKGRAASVDAGLIKEWLGAQLAQALALPLPAGKILYVDDSIILEHSEAASALGEGYVFGSEQIPSVTELKYELISQIPPEQQKDILLFDLWVQNEDRTLSEWGGNPNLLWKSEQSKLYLIDHNLIFDNQFNINDFWETHVFKHIIFDLIDRLNYQERMQKALKCWQSAWDVIPEEWKDENNGFVPNEILQGLKSDVDGGIWRKLR